MCFELNCVNIVLKCLSLSHIKSLSFFTLVHLFMSWHCLKLEMTAERLHFQWRISNLPNFFFQFLNMFKPHRCFQFVKPFFFRVKCPHLYKKCFTETDNDSLRCFYFRRFEIFQMNSEDKISFYNNIDEEQSFFLLNQWQLYNAINSISTI